MTTDEKLSRELETLRNAMIEIAAMPEEDNEWHAVELYSQARETALQALKKIGVRM